jgi:hypothetical protein
LLVSLDTNADNKLTKQEFEAQPADQAEGGKRRGPQRSAERQKLLFSFYDRNGDGAVEKAEYEAGRNEELAYAKRKRLHALDRDGRITAADLPPLERQRWSQR